MTTIDIREGNVPELRYIRFEDTQDDGYRATRLRINKAEGDIWIEEDDYENNEAVRIANSDHARNLIIALEKAIELGYLK